MFHILSTIIFWTFGGVWFHIVGMSTKTPLRAMGLTKPKKTDAIRVRLDPSMKQRMEQIAMVQDLDVSDVARHAFSLYLSKLQQPMTA